MPVPEFLKTPLTVYDIAKQYWDLKAYPTQYFFSLLALVADDKLEREKCIELSSPSGQEDWLNYARRPKRTPLEVLHDFHKTASKLNIEILFELFCTIKPRSFSIASYQASVASLDVLVAVVQYTTIIKRPRLGLASNWLKDLKVGDRVYGWIKKGSFVYPNYPTPIIMVGPGTGLAAFRSFLQHRQGLGTAGHKVHHLVFGCRYKERDFHCREELEEMVEDGLLSLYCAFSRDQERKIYVQHIIRQHSSKFWQLISEQNAHIFVSGNAKIMPDEVREAFTDICRSGDTDPVAFIQEMERNGRYQVETW